MANNIIQPMTVTLSRAADGNIVREGVFICHLPIEVGTPVSPDAPLADPGVRNYRRGLLRKARTRNQR